MKRKINHCKKAALSLLLLAVCAGCRYPWSQPERQTPVDSEVKQALDETGDLIVSSRDNVYSVNSQTQQSKLILHTQQPISGVEYTAERLAVAVYDPNDSQAFKGLYVRGKAGDAFTQIATPQMQPKLCYSYGDYIWVAAADKTDQKGAEYTKVGIFQLSVRKWVKEWLVPGGIEDAEGSGKNVYFVTSNNKDTSSNLYKADVTTGDWGKLIQEARRYPLDEVALDSNGEIYMMISQRAKTEWSNKVYHYNPAQSKYELFDNFVSNTKPYSYHMDALLGKALIIRNDVTETSEIEKPIALLDLASRKQMFIPWDHRPVAATHSQDEFVVLADDGTVAFIKPVPGEQPLREFHIEGMESGVNISMKRDEK
ncbi:hypothetical protein [Paenibacillus thalictri]|uniref:WD40 repeat domain-containing protein n=1 Tax=Paenibacillus thalictri TaxID=2527873 RepID=A0A4V2J3M1_9BACL|nr:hypothetical protein [Paenibacillus thalictri]TBL73357.1 hypothetical protein EYB31_27150 [Paenibacillus thalictri]